MIRVRSLTVALGLAMGILAASTLLLPVTAQAADQSKQKFSRAVGEPLKKAQEAIQKKQFETALAELNKARAVEKRTAFEDYQIDEFLGYILVLQKKYLEATAVYDRMLNSGQMPAAEVDDRTKAVAQMYFQVREYKKASDWAKKWLDKHPGNEDMMVLLGQTHYLLNDYKSAATVMSQVVANAERAGQTPKENHLDLVLSSYFNQSNNDGMADALKKLVRYYPKPKHWDALIEINRRKSDTGDRVTLGYYRLMNDVGVLKDKGDVMEMAQLGIEAGVPGESQQVVEKGIEEGTLKTEDKTEQGRYSRLLAAAKKQAASDKASLVQLAKDAEKAPQGQADVALGQAYLSYGQYDEAIAALERGIKKGSVIDADEAQISLGIAHLKKGEQDRARQAFKAVKADSKWSRLADLWVVRTHAPA